MSDERNILEVEMKYKSYNFEFASIFFAMGLAIPLLGLTLSDLTRRFEIPLSQGGQFITLMGAGVVIASFVAGILFDQLSAQIAAPIGVGVLIISQIILVTAPDRVIALTGALLLGLGFGTLIVGLNALISRINTEKPARALSAMNLVYGIGAILSPQLVTIALLFGETRGAYAIVAIFLAFGLLMSIKLDIPSEASNRNGEVVQLKLFRLLPFIIALFSLISVEVGFNAWIVPQLERAAGMKLATANVAASLFWLNYTLARLATAVIGNRFHPGRILIISSTLLFFGLAILLIAPSSKAIGVMSSIVIGVAVGPLFPLTIAMAGQTFPGSVGKALGIISAVGNVGPMVIPLIMGYVGAGRDGGMEVLLITSVFLLVAVIIVSRHTSQISKLEVSLKSK